MYAHGWPHEVVLTEQDRLGEASRPRKDRSRRSCTTAVHDNHVARPRSGLRVHRGSATVASCTQVQAYGLQHSPYRAGWKAPQGWRKEHAMTWVPAECTLPLTERAGRAAEFDELFATALLRHARPEPTLLRLTLDGSDQVAAATRKLVAKEAACCSVFDFTLTQTPDRALQLEVRVPAERSKALDGLATRAAGATRGRSR